MSKQESNHTPGSGIAIGLAFGTAFGVALDNIGLGLSLGIVFGSAIDLSRSKSNSGKESEHKPNDGKDGS